jgi:hypothetical protein
MFGGSLFTGVIVLMVDVRWLGGVGAGRSWCCLRCGFLLGRIALCRSLVGVSRYAGSLWNCAVGIISCVALCGFLVGVALCGFVVGCVVGVFSGIVLCGFVGGVALCGFIGRGLLCVAWEGGRHCCRWALTAACRVWGGASWVLSAVSRGRSKVYG